MDDRFIHSGWYLIPPVRLYNKWYPWISMHIPTAMPPLDERNINITTGFNDMNGISMKLQDEMDVSWNGGTLRSSTLVGFSINLPFEASPIYGKPQIWNYCLKKRLRCMDEAIPAASRFQWGKIQGVSKTGDVHRQKSTHSKGWNWFQRKLWIYQNKFNMA